MSKLAGLLVAISVSDAPDRARLGFPRREIDRAVLSLCTALVRDGAEIAYGGNLDPEGYTFKIFRHLAGAYAGARETPFRHFIPEPVARLTLYEDLLFALCEGRGTARTELARGDAFITARPRQGAICLGDETIVHNDEELAAWFDESPRMDIAAAYSAARRMITARAHARIVVGGKMGIIGQAGDAYQGVMPGIAEEAIMTLEAGKPLVAIGAFGGAARDIAIALGLIDPTEKVPRTEQPSSYAIAMCRIAALRDRIPVALREPMLEIARDDRAEQTGFRVATLICQWTTMRREGAC